MPDPITITLEREEAERIISSLNGPHDHVAATPEKGFPSCPGCDARDKLRTALDSLSNTGEER